MKKSNNLVAALVIGATFSGVAFADAEKRTVNQELSDVRIQISKQILENKLSQAKLDGLQKKQEIQIIQNTLDGVSSGSITSSAVDNTKKDNSFQFNETINEEDILSEGNDWKQSVGFIYKDDLDLNIDNNTNENSPISNLTSSSEDLDFEAMLEQVTSESVSNVSDDEKVSTGEKLNDIDDFKLIGIELSKLNIYGEEKKGAIKINYITNNGYQKIKGAKIVNVTEGSKFNIKGKTSFEVLSIDDNGIEYKNLDNQEIGRATR